MLTHHPPVAGAIFWERQLFHRLKGPVIIFQNVEELKHSDLKMLAFQQYLAIATQMKSFEESKFNSWIEKASRTVVTTMRKSVLKISPVECDSSTFLDFFFLEKSINCQNNTFRSKINSCTCAAMNLKTLPTKLSAGISAAVKKSKSKEHGTAERSAVRPDVMISKQSTGNFCNISCIDTTIFQLTFLNLFMLHYILDTFGSFVAGSRQRLVLPSLRGRANSKGGGDSRDFKASTVSSLTDKPAAKITWKEIIHGTTIIENQLRFEVNFNREVFEIIHEVSYLI